MKDKMYPFVVIAVFALLFNVILVRNYGQMPNTEYMFLVIGNVIFMISNIVAAVASFKKKDK